jgi:hypothetical protein
MADMAAGVVVGFISGVAGTLAWASWTIKKSKAIRRRNMIDLSRIYDDDY